MILDPFVSLHCACPHHNHKLMYLQIWKTQLTHRMYELD